MLNADQLINLTKKMVRIPSISGSKNDIGEYNENVLADMIFKILKNDNITSGFIPTSDGRKCVYGFKKGSTNKTLILLGLIVIAMLFCVFV